jgi:energy-coupling factor transporter transmembrane protein EcfT
MARSLNRRNPYSLHRNPYAPRRIPFSYRAGTSPLHRFSAGFKLLCLLALSIAAFSSIPGLLLSALLVWAAALIARIRPRELLCGCRPLVILSLFILIFKTVQADAPGISLGAINTPSPEFPALHIPFISPEGFLGGILSGLRIMVSYCAGSLLFAVTTMRELRRSLGRAERVILGLFPQRRETAGRRITNKADAPIRCSRLSLGISLMLGFIPRFFELWETTNLACDARVCKRGLRRLMLIIPLVTERMMEAAADTAQALEARSLPDL